MKRTRSIKGKLSEDDEIYKDLKINKIMSKQLSVSKTNKSEISKENTNEKDKILDVTIKNVEKRMTRSKSKLKSDYNLLIDIKSEISQIETQSKIISSKPNKKEKLKIQSKNLLGPKCIRLGLCCINNFLRGKKNTVFCSRSITLSTYKSKGKEEAISRATQNIKDIEKMIRWNHSHYIHVLRLSSDMFPHYTNITYIDKDDLYTLDFAKTDLKQAGDLARELGHRITMHPGQFNVVGTPNEDVFTKTCLDLKMHADILDYMEMDMNSIMVVHGGGTYGDKENTIKRWISNFHRLPINAQKRLVLENDEKNFNIKDCLIVNEAIGIPIVFDNHHFECYKKLHPSEEFENISYYIKPVLETWTKKGLRPKFHISNQAPDKNTGAHSDYIESFPDYYLEIPTKYGIGVDIMIEAKAKEAAIFDLYSRYPKYFLNHVDEEYDEEMFAFDKEKMMAKSCSKC